ncbi:hypothetical protein OQ257_11415 [Actinobacillus equuli subsp. equuli]|uniref:Zona occludens toxin N-terminal domain-containing protein n=1 Tax=Actinobacillus equuli subsp. equuli TaxID=202947 RepID=A0A9X4G8Z3_ACTEU|nr:zonular occludens toxin domain-containing protein [Actinobacillus equuli]MDE8035764.1 hypothetical protein [Actinobacillus equuli subsp. equuli]
MAIFAYTGIPGSGKTYEVVSSVILEAFKKGRCIVTNIEGIDEQRFIDYCLSTSKLTRSDLGSILKVTDDDCQRDDFFPFKGSVGTICKAGDLICLDEIWRIFPSDKIHENHRSFIAEHRHFTNENGDCCDLVVINQAISGVPRFIKDRVETTFVMKKMTMLGSSRRYRVDVFTGAKVNKSTLVAQYHNKYNNAIFALYKSFDGINGKQNVVDGRQNIFKSPQFLFTVFFGLVCIFGSGYLLMSLIDKNTQSPAPLKVPIKNNECVKLVSVKKIGDITMFTIKKGDKYERVGNLNNYNVCNLSKFERKSTR